MLLACLLVTTPAIGQSILERVEVDVNEHLNAAFRSLREDRNALGFRDSCSGQIGYWGNDSCEPSAFEGRLVDPHRFAEDYDFIISACLPSPLPEEGSVHDIAFSVASFIEQIDETLNRMGYPREIWRAIATEFALNHVAQQISAHKAGRIVDARGQLEVNFEIDLIAVLRRYRNKNSPSLLVPGSYWGENLGCGGDVFAQTIFLSTTPPAGQITIISMRLFRYCEMLGLDLNDCDANPIFVHQRKPIYAARYWVAVRWPDGRRTCTVEDFSQYDDGETATLNFHEDAVCD